jgi:hypothetical protein
LLVSLLAVFALGAVTSASASASNDVWEVCEENKETPKEPPVKYDEHKCNTKAKALSLRKWEWKVLAAGKSYNTTSNIVAGTTEVLTVTGKAITCTGETDKGTITGPGKDLAETITFTGCTTSKTGCLVKTAGQANGTIVLTKIPTKLEQRVVGGVEVLVDNFEQKEVSPGKFEFVTLKFEPKASCEPTFPEETKVKGSVAAKVKTLTNGEVELEFPSPALPGDSLEAFGVEALFTSRDELSLENGWALRAS